MILEKIAQCLGCPRSTLVFPCRSVLAALLVFCLVYSASARESIASSMSLHGGLVKLPVIGKRDIRFTRLVANGESLESRIWSIAQDNYGFLWLGTSDGLYRYDGYNLKRYPHDLHDPKSVSDDTVAMVYKDRAGFLWICTKAGGLDRLDPTNETFTHFRHQPANPRSLSVDGVNCAYQDRDGALWVGTDNGLDRLDEPSGSFTHYRNNPADPASLSNDHVNNVLEDRRGNLWVGTEWGLNRLDRTTSHFSRFLHDPAKPDSLGHNYVSRILEDHSGILWVSSPLGSGLSALDVNTGKFTRYSFHTEEPGDQSVAGVNSVFEDVDGLLWLCTVDHGLLRLDSNRKGLVRYTKASGDPNSLLHDTVHVVFEDTEGIMWVGTQSGLCRFPRRPSAFVNYKHEADNQDSLYDNMIWSVRTASDGSLWIGTEEGLDRLNPRTGHFTVYRHDPKDPHSLSYDKVAAIREDPSGALWFGTYGGGLNRFDPKSGEFFAYRHQPKNPGSLGSDSVLSLLIDSTGTLWVGTQGGGLDRFDQKTGKFKAYLSEPSDLDSLLLTLFEDRAGFLWVGSQGRGLYRFNPRTEQFTRYHHDSENVLSLSHDKVNAIREDRQGRLWIGTENGLNLMDRGRGTFVVLTVKDGLPDNAIRAILEDDRGYLWLATHNGLSRFDPAKRTFHNYFESDGLASNFLSPYAAEDSYLGSDGEIVLGSSNGLTTFYPRRISVDSVVPPVVLTEFDLFNKPVRAGRKSPLRQPIWATDSLTLTHEQSIFTVEFAGLSYAVPERNRYRYRLEGLENQWNEVDSGRRRATYTSLAAGKYVFRVLASNKDGVWNEKGATLNITILPPWWATWWFLSIAALMIAALVLAAYRSRMRSLQMVLEGRLAERIRIAQELHDTLIQDVVAVGLQLDIIDDQLSNEPNAVRRTLDLTRRRVRELSERGRRTLSHLRSATTPSIDLAESLSRVGKNFHTGEAPDFQVLVQGDLRPLDSSIRGEVEHIGTEAITNAFRHARANRIEVGLFYSDRTLRLVVRDDGCGIASNIILKGRPEHFGLKGMRERAERIGGRLTVLSRPGGGTEVSLVVPLRSSNRRHAQF
jgi:ligand-binding sensor domain-containing protein/signal transduction histidine kinase